MDKGSNPKLIRLRKDKDVVVQDVIATYDAQNSVDVDVMKNVFTTAFLIIRRTAMVLSFGRMVMVGFLIIILLLVGGDRILVMEITE